MPSGLVQLRPGRDLIVQHQQVQAFLAVFLVHGGDQHPAGVDAHHGSGGQVHDGHAGLADQLLRLVIVVDAAQNDAIRAGPVVQNELQELLGLLHGFAGLDLHHAEVGLAEGLKIHELLEERLDLHVGEVDLPRGGLRGLGGLGGLFGLVGLGLAQGLHGRDFRDQP